VQGKLGKWRFKGKNYGYEGYMFPLLVQEQLEIWPEQSVRQRTWVSKGNVFFFSFFLSMNKKCT